MSKPMARLRANLDFMPSPDPDRPGLLIRDAYRYSDATLIIPTALVGGGVLEDETYARRREERHRQFAGEPRREATHSGSAYPDEPAALRETLGGWVNWGRR